MRTAMTHVVLIVLLSALLTTSGCYSCAVSIAKCAAKHKTSESVTHDFEPGSKLSVRSEFGPISVSAGDVTDCRIEGRVYVHAPTKQEAREIGEQVQIAAERRGETLLVTIEKPALEENRSVWMELDIVVPAHAHVDCQTEFGRINVAEVTGDVRAVTEFGAITLDEIASSNITAKTEFGVVRVKCADTCPADLIADVQTEFGKIRFDAPESFQGYFDIGTDFGSAKTKLSTASQGKWTKGRKTATTGSGAGKLSLRTDFGSVRLK